MLEMKGLAIIISLTFSLCCAKMNVPRVLLPLFRDFTTNFTLEVTEPGCYTWSTLKSDIVRLQCLHEETESGCCSRVTVFSNVKELRRIKETVIAEDVHSGQVWRCDVILDIIRNLHIDTSTRELFLEEPPEAFEVKAYDDQGNVFSSLEGVEIDWSIRTLGTQNKTGESTVVRYITFGESPYETPRSIEALERQGLKGHIILLDGKQTGTAAVSAKLPQVEYTDVGAAGVNIFVRTNLMIVPPDVTLLVDDQVKFRLQQYQQGRVTQIPFPSVQYHLMSKDKTIEVNPKTGITKALSLGKAEIVLVDSNVAKSDVKPPTATVTIATPHELSLNLLPYQKWSVIIDQVYKIEAILFDSARKRFHIGENVHINIDINSIYFQSDWKAANGSYVIGVPLKAGKTLVKAEFRGKNTFLTAQEELHIYNKIQVIPDFVVFPWDPVVKSKYELQLTALGGDGVFTWASCKNNIAVVTQKGLVKTLEGGSTNITAFMTSNSALKGVCTVRIEPPLSLNILDLNLDAEIKSAIYVHVVLQGASNKSFTACDALPFEVTISESNFEKLGLKPSLVDGSCAAISILGHFPGTSLVTIRYGKLEASTVVSTYRPLRPLNPKSGQTVLALGTSRLVVFSGGPRSWSLRPSEHRHFLNKVDPDKLLITEFIKLGGSTSRDIFAYRVQCRELSETTVTLEVVNKIIGSLSEPIRNTASVTIVCGKPKFLLLSSPLNKRCPIAVEESVALSSQDFDVEVTVTDAHGRKFDNISTLEFHWSVSKPFLAKVTESPGLRETVFEEDGFQFPGIFYQTFVTKGKTGVFQVQSSVTNYVLDYLFGLGIEPENPVFAELDSYGVERTPDIQAVLNVLLVNETKVTPEKTEIHMGGSDYRNLTVTHGSGYFDYELNSDGIVRVSRTNQIIRVEPLNVGKTILSVFDICLDTSPVSIPIQVFKIGAIVVNVAERVERGKKIYAKINIFDEEGLLLKTTSNIDLKAKASSSGILIDPSDEPLTLIVTGHELGQTFLEVSSDDVVSSPTPILVFSPIRVNPQNVTLFVGASLQLSVLDGPPDSHFEYLADDITTAKVSADGIVKALRIGTTELIVRAISTKKDTGEKVVDSQDVATIRVIPLKSVSISVPITRIVAGGRMPVWAIGSPGSKEPLKIGSSISVKLSWTLSHLSNAELNNPFYYLGVRVPENELVIMHFLALKPGRVTISLIVQVPGQLTGTLQSMEFSDSISIEILPRLGLSSPRNMPLDYLLVSPEATTVLRTTAESRKFSSVSLDGKVSDLKISPDGVLSTGSSLGTAVISFGASHDTRKHLLVYVKPVEYVMFNLAANWRIKDDAGIHVVPNGLDLTLSVSFHDDEGNVFDAVRSDVRVEFDLKGLATYTRGSDNSTLTLSLLNPGDFTVRIWNEPAAGKSSSDYIKFHTADLLYPGNTRVTVGDVICLQMPVLYHVPDDSANEKQLQSVWKVDDGRKLRIWPEEGLAAACHSPGVVSVSHRATSRLKSRIEITPLHKIDFLPSEQVLTTTADSVFDYPLLLRGQGEIEKRTNLIAPNGTCLAVDSKFSSTCFPFTCHMKFNNPAATKNIASLFYIEPAFDLQSGLYTCRVRTLEKPTQSSSTLVEDIVITAESVEGGNVRSRPALIRFLPALYVQQHELKVAYNKPHDVIVVWGIDEVFLHFKFTADSHFVTITLLEKSPTSRSYSIKVDEAWWLLEDPPKLTIHLYSKITKQHIVVPIKCTGFRVIANDNVASWWGWHTWLLIAIAIISIAIGKWLSKELFSKRNPSMPSTILTRESPFLRDHTFSSPSYSQSSSPSGSFYGQSSAFDSTPVYGSSPWRDQTPISAKDMRRRDVRN